MDKKPARALPMLRLSLTLVLLALLGSAALMISRASADPGSKEDPLATVGYVQKKAQFTRRSLPAGSLQAEVR